MKKPSDTIEDYLKTIFKLTEEKNRSIAPLKEVSQVMKVTSGTITSMMKKLENMDYITYHPWKGCSLTTRGKSIAIETLRKHRLIETFLVSKLKMDWSKVHGEAEKMEHAFSSEVIDKLEVFLKYPLSDPHGDPIPQKNGTLKTSHFEPLVMKSVGKEMKIRRIICHETPLFTFFKDNHIMPGAIIKIINISTHAKTMEVEVNNHITTIAFSIAELILL